MIGIYKITNRINNRCYIGYSTNLKQREKSHFMTLKSGKHYSLLMQEDYNIYTKNNFNFEIICHLYKSVTKWDMIDFEEFFIKLHKPEYNSARSLPSEIKNYMYMQFLKDTKKSR